ncbi:MAG: acylphosphatase [Sandaracinaceae bacterium]|nr:acylphosphatase [Sandaracinaceae bacterium]
MGQKRIQLICRGRVQGVYFRALCASRSSSERLSGWVKNRSDGSVELIVEGEEDAVKDFLQWAQTGPSTARVDKVETKWRSYTGEFSGFRIAGN